MKRQMTIVKYFLIVLGIRFHPEQRVQSTYYLLFGPEMSSVNNESIMENVNYKLSQTFLILEPEKNERMQLIVLYVRIFVIFRCKESEDIYDRQFSITETFVCKS